MVRRHYRRHQGLSQKFPLEYQVWNGMMQRCHNRNNQAWNRYGGRGIQVCDKWRRSFRQFLKDMGPKPSAEQQLDRIDNNGHYEPSNCRWTNSSVQGRNKRNNRILTHQGKSLCVEDWAERLDISSCLIRARLDRLGWSVERSLSTPSRSLTKTFTHNQITKSVFQWSRDLKIDFRMVHCRINKLGWSIEEALFTPPLNRSECASLSSLKMTKEERREYVRKATRIK